MIALSKIVKEFKSDCVADYGHRLNADQFQALHAMEACRNHFSPLMQVSCTDCEHQEYVPHSCGHRSCPHCQHHDKSAG